MQVLHLSSLGRMVRGREYQDRRPPRLEMLNKEPLTAGLTSIYRGGAEDEGWTTAPGEEGAVETNKSKNDI